MAERRLRHCGAQTEAKAAAADLAGRITDVARLRGELANAAAEAGALKAELARLGQEAAAVERKLAVEVWLRSLPFPDSAIVSRVRRQVGMHAKAGRPAQT